MHGSACSWMIALLGFTCPVDTRVMSSEAKTLRVPLAPSSLKQQRMCAAQRRRGTLAKAALIDPACIKSGRYQKFKSTLCTVAVHAGITQPGHTVGNRHVSVAQLNLEENQENSHIFVREEVVLG